MTITYTVSPIHGDFFSLLFRWRGSIWRHIWHKLAIWCTAYAAVSLTYRLALADDQKETFIELAKYFNISNKQVPLTFLLGFYVNQVIRRWYDQYNQITKLDSYMVLISSIIRGPNEIRCRLIRRTLARYANLACMIVWRGTMLRVKKRFPKDKHLINAGLMTHEEKEEYDAIGCPSSSHLVPLMWMTNLCAKCYEEGMITDYQLDRLIDGVNTIRGQLGQLGRYEWIQIPLIYTQVVTLATYGYFLFGIIGRQYVGKGIDLYVPLLTILEFVFYVGWLQVAEDLFNPFGEDDEDFEVNTIVDKNISKSFFIVDQLHGRIGSLTQDKLWSQRVAKAPHTVASSKVTEHSFPGHLSKYRLKESQMEIVEPEFAKVEAPETSLEERLRASKLWLCCSGNTDRESPGVKSSPKKDRKTTAKPAENDDLLPAHSARNNVDNNKDHIKFADV